MSFPRYPKYKESGVEWLGQVPEHWDVKRLKRACHVFPSNVDKKSYADETAVLLCNYTDVYYNDTITAGMDFMPATASADQIKKFTLRAGDTIITKDSETADDIAIAAYVPADLPGVVCGYHLSMVRPLEGTIGVFIKWFFDSAYARASFEVLANGLTRVGLGQHELDNVELLIPPAAEQKSIAEFLDQETAKIDVLVAEQQRLMALLKEKCQAVITHAVTKGLNPKAPMKPSGIEWLGDVPAHWRVMPLGRVTLSRCDGPFGSGLKSEHYTDSGVRVIRLQNIRRDGFDDSGEAFIDADYYARELSGHDVVCGDVLIAGLGDDKNTVGRACVAPAGIEPAMVKADCFRYRLDTKQVLPEFVATELSASSAADAGMMSSGSTRSRIPLSVMATRKLAIPPIGEQKQIVDFLRAESLRFVTLTAEAQRAIDLLQERRIAVISAAVTGQIDARNH